MSKAKKCQRLNPDPLCELGFPWFDKYVETECKTVNALFNKSEIASLGDSFNDEINRLQALMNRHREDKWRKLNSINFYAEINSAVEEKKGQGVANPKTHKVGLGARVEFDDKHHLKNSTYLIEIHGEESSNYADKILTRIHFDVTSNDSRNSSQYPIYHLQVGGDPSHGHSYAAGLDESEHDLIKPISYPRIPIYPLSFALFIDMTFRELGNEDAQMFIKGDYWRGLVRDNEMLLLQPFLKCVLRRQEINKEDVAKIYYDPFGKA